MLRVGTQQVNGSLICSVEGRLTGEGAEQVRTLVTRGDVRLKLVVDLTEMMFIDAIGEEVLSFAEKLGAQFIAETSYSRDVCERLNLPLVKYQQTVSIVGQQGRKWASSGQELSPPIKSESTNS